MKTVSAHTKLYGIFGNPVKHSLSPIMQNAAFEAADVDAVYLAFCPSSLEAAIAAMRALPIHGASITIPYKTAVMDLIDAIDPLAQDIGAVNTLHNDNGRVVGYNTDGYGACEALTRAGISLEKKRVLVLGNGGSARAIAFSLLEKKCNLAIAGRNPDKFRALVDDLRKKDSSVSGIALSALDTSFMEEIDIVINTTSVGMEPDISDMPIEEGLLFSRHAVFDIVYRPHLTALLSSARRRGCPVVFGIDMLLFQGARQFEIWTGIPAPVSVMQKALSSVLEK